jgi:hypothetical protein
LAKLFIIFINYQYFYKWKLPAYMKKPIFLLFIVTLIAVQIIAQPSASKFSAEVLIGGSFPVGKFGDKSVSQLYANEFSGWAEPGPAVQLSLNYRLGTLYGISLVFGGQENKEDANSLNDFYNGAVGGSDTYSTNPDQWKIGRILAGGYLRIPVSNSNNVFLQPKLLAGILKTGIPGYSLTISTMSNGMLVDEGTEKLPSVSLPWAFCYQLGAGLAWDLTPRTSLSLDMNYFHSEPSSKNTAYASQSLGNGTKFPVAGINLMAGAGIRF